MSRRFTWGWFKQLLASGRRPPSPDWLIYVLDGHPPSEFYHPLFIRAAGSSIIVNIAEGDNFAKDSGYHRTPFVYIGHGTDIGVYSSVGFEQGLRNFLWDGQKASDFVGSPQIWWSCFSAQWLRRNARTDWFGYAGLLGADPRGSQEEWWTQQLLVLIGQLMDAARARCQPSDVRDAADRMHEQARQQYYDGKRLSWTSVLCARFIAVGIDWHPQFGGTRP